MNSVLTNTPLLTALIATAAAQIIKLAIILIADRKLALGRLLETGGMPSSHTAAVAALATSFGLKLGWNSPEFAIATVFGGIVMYDATGIRRAAGVQAELINDLVQELAHLFDEGFQPQALKTLLGHTYPQVLVGALVGIGTAMLVSF